MDFLLNKGKKMLGLDDNAQETDDSEHTVGGSQQNVNKTMSDVNKAVTGVNRTFTHLQKDVNESEHNIEDAYSYNQTLQAEDNVSNKTDNGDDDAAEYGIPGKLTPTRVDSDTVELICNYPWKLEDEEHFQMRYKDVDGNKKWKIYQEEFITTSFVLKHLKANTRYIFKVRIVNDDEEGPYSPESDVIVTTTSAAEQLANFCVEVEQGHPKVLKVPLTEIVKARNEKGKTRKFLIGESRKDYVKQKTIMLIGATGTGKSTLVDGIVNYVLGVNWDDPYRFSIVNLEAVEEKRKENQALSQTEWITCYSMYPTPGCRLKYKLNIIDTPGFGDTRGLKRDREIVSQIRELFESTGDQGIADIDAVCFLAKAPDARLTAVQTYIFHSIMSLFGKDIENNICTLITFADGQEPPVLAALEESRLPFGDHFTFNNSALFAKNTNEKNANSPLFWHMGSESYKRFFDHCETFQTQSLVLTKDVQQQRERLEITVTDLQPQIDNALSKIETMRQEIKIIEQHKVDIDANKDFTYETTEEHQVATPTPIGVHVTNCMTCNRTCHPRCAFADDDDKKYCGAMKPNGYCGQCQVNGRTCYWTLHKNTRVIYSFKTVKKTETYQNKLEIYEKAHGKLLDSKGLLELITKDIDDLENEIRDSMEIVNECNNRLKEIALNANPLTMTEYIDLMISAEEQGKKPGFQRRINALKECKKRAEVEKNVSNVVKDISEHKAKGKGIFSKMIDYFKS